jgi:hypothetical protein
MTLVRIGRRTAATVVAATLLAAMALGQSVGPVGARGEIGPYYGAKVLCNPYDNVITINPRAGANAAFDSQWIYAQMSLWQEGVGWRGDLTPPMTSQFRHDRVTHGQTWGWGTIPSVSNDVLGATWYARPGEGRYAIVTHYWFWDGFEWVGPYEAWTDWMDYNYSLAPHSTYWCDLTLV